MSPIFRFSCRMEKQDRNPFGFFTNKQPVPTIEQRTEHIQTPQCREAAIDMASRLDKATEEAIAKALAKNDTLAAGRALLIGIHGTDAFIERMAKMSADIEQEQREIASEPEHQFERDR